MAWRAASGQRGPFQLRRRAGYAVIAAESRDVRPAARAGRLGSAPRNDAYTQDWLDYYASAEPGDVPAHPPTGGTDAQHRALWLAYINACAVGGSRPAQLPAVFASDSEVQSAWAAAYDAAPATGSSGVLPSNLDSAQAWLDFYTSSGEADAPPAPYALDEAGGRPRSVDERASIWAAFYDAAARSRVNLPTLPDAPPAALAGRSDVSAAYQRAVSARTGQTTHPATTDAALDGAWSALSAERRRALLRVIFAEVMNRQPSADEGAQLDAAAAGSRSNADRVLGALAQSNLSDLRADGSAEVAHVKADGSVEYVTVTPSGPVAIGAAAGGSSSGGGGWLLLAAVGLAAGWGALKR